MRAIQLPVSSVTLVCFSSFSPILCLFQLCQVVGAQHYLRKLTPAQVTEISRVTAMPPADRKSQCENVSGLVDKTCWCYPNH